MKEITRRTMLKGAVAAGAMAAVGGKLFSSPSIAIAESDVTSVKEDVWISSACWMCREGCAIRVHRVDGVIMKVEGDPNCHMNKGKICGRAHPAAYKTYNPYRVKTPVKRTNPEKGRGVDPKWVEITWDEAYELCASKIKAVMADNPNEFMLTHGWGGGYSGGWVQFNQAVGSKNRQSGYGGIVCGAGQHHASYNLIGASSDRGDTRHSMFMVRSSSYGVNKGGVEDVYKFVSKREGGMKFIVVDPRMSVEATKADEWIPIRPGSDRLMQLAIMHVLFYELPKELGREAVDVDRMKLMTNMPYLIRCDGGPEDGEYLRNNEVKLKDPSRKNKEFGKPYVWDTKEKKAKLWDDPTVMKNYKNLALEGEFVVDGVKVKPAFQLFKDNLKQYTPEMQESVTTVPAATVRRLARMYHEEARIDSTIAIPGPNGESTVMPYRPIGTRWRGTRMNDAWDPMTSFLLQSVLGGNGVPGGLIGEGGDCTASPADGVSRPKGTSAYRFEWPPDSFMMNTWYPTAYKTVPVAYQAMQEPSKYGLSYKTKVMMVHGCNPIMAGGATEKVLDSLRTIDFIFALAYHFDEAVAMSDVVLPEPGYTGWLREGGGAWLHQPLLDKDIYDTRQVEDIYIELAEKAGILEKLNEVINSGKRLRGDYALDVKKKYTWRDILDRILQQKYGEKTEWFEKNGCYPEVFDAREDYEYFKYPEGKTRYQLYQEYLLWAGREHKRDLAAKGQGDLETIHPGAYKLFTALPYWEEVRSLASAPAEFDLYGINWKGSLMSMGQTMDNPVLREYMDHYDHYSMYAWMNADTAASKGLKNGDLIWVESWASKERVQAEVKASQCIHPSAIAIGGEFGQWSHDYSPVAKNIGPHYNKLLDWGAESLDALSAGFTVLCKVKIYKV